MKKNKKVILLVLAIIIITTVVTAIHINQNTWIPHEHILSEYGYENNEEEKKFKEKASETSFYLVEQDDQNDKKIRDFNEKSLKERLDESGVLLGRMDKSFYETAESFTDSVDKKIIIPKRNGDVSIVRVSNKEMLLLKEYDVSFICPKQ